MAVAKQSLEEDGGDETAPLESVAKKTKLRTMPVMPPTKEEPLSASYLTVVKEFNALSKDATKVKVSEVPQLVMAEIRHLVQMLGNMKEEYRAASFPLLEALMMRYPVLYHTVYNNIMFIYRQANKSIIQKQAKLMGMGSILRAGCSNARIVKRLVAEIIMMRNASDKDDIEALFLISALQNDELVASVSELILEGLEEELSKHIKEQRLTGLWLRLSLVHRMLQCGLRMPMWLKDTISPDRVVHFGYVLMPHSQKVEPTHPVFECFIPMLLDCHNILQKKRMKKKNATVASLETAHPNPVAVLFREEICPAISCCFGSKRKKISLEIAYKLLYSLLSCTGLQVSVLESVVSWVALGGLTSLTIDARRQLILGLLKKFSSIIEDNPDDDKIKSEVAVCILEAAVVLPELMSHSKDYLAYLTPHSAQACVDSKLRISWKKLTEPEATVFLKLVSLRQCSGSENIVWKKQVASRLTKRAMEEKAAKLSPSAGATREQDAHKKDGNSSEKDESDNEDSETEKSDNADDSDNEDKSDKEDKEAEKRPPKGEEKLVGHMELLYRYLGHISNDKMTVCEMFMEIHRVAIEEVNNNPDLLGLSDELKETWTLLADKVKLLQDISQEDFPCKKIFQWLISQFGIEMIHKPVCDSQDLISDIVTCLDKAIEEINNGGIGTSGGVSAKKKIEQTVEKSKSSSVSNKKLEKDGSDSDWETDESDSESEDGEWVVVLLDVLLALATRVESWWRTVLMPAGKILSGRVTLDCATTILDVLLKDDVLMPNQSDDEQEKDEEDVNDEEDDSENDTDSENEEDEMQEKRKNDSQDDDSEEEDDSDASDEDDDSDDDDDHSEGESDDGVDEDETRLDAMKKRLMMAMGPMTSSGDAGLDGEDMDAVPRAELNRLNVAMGSVLKEFIKKPRRNKKSLVGEDMQLMQYRNRTMDVLAGVVEGSPRVDVLLTIMKLLVAALKQYKAKVMKDLTNRIRDVLKSVRATKKFVHLESVTFVSLLEHLQEIFSFANVVPECCYAVVAILRLSIHIAGQTDSSLNPVIEAYVANVTATIGNRKFNKHVLLESLNLDMPEMRSKIVLAIVDKITTNSSATMEQNITTKHETENNDSLNGNDSGSSTVIAATGAIQGSSNRSKHALWQVLQEIYAKILTANVELGDLEKEAVTVVGRNIHKYLDECQMPNKKELAPISIILKLIKKCAAASSCVDWTAISASLKVFRSRVSSKLIGNKHFKRDVDRLATVTLLTKDQISTEAKEEKQNLKRKRKELREEKIQNKKIKLEMKRKVSEVAEKEAPVAKKSKQSGSDELFGDGKSFLDADDPDSEQESDGHNSELEDQLQDKKLRKFESLRKKKAEKNKTRKLRLKVNKKIRKEVAKERKMQKNKEKQNNREMAKEKEDNDDKVEKQNDEEKQTDKVEKQTRKQFKQVRNESDKKLSENLKVGIFSSNPLADDE